MREGVAETDSARAPVTAPRAVHLVHLARLALLAALVLALSASVVVLTLAPGRMDLTGLGEAAASYGVLAFAALIVAWSLTTLPAIPLMVAAGALFGPWIGALLSLSGSMIGVSLTFAIGRALGAARFESLSRRHPRLERALGLVASRPFAVVALLRLAPVFPISTLNYLLGATSMSFAVYFWGSFVMIVPGAALYAGVGDVLLRWWTRQPIAISTFVSVSVAAVVALLVTWWLRHVRQAAAPAVERRHDACDPVLRHGSET